MASEGLGSWGVETFTYLTPAGYIVTTRMILHEGG